MKRPVFRWRRRMESGREVQRAQATVMIQIGLAWRSHGDGDLIGAIRHLRIAADGIMQLVEEWSKEPHPPNGEESL